MPKYINLKDAKQHLRVDFADDDAYIMSLISMVEMAVELEIGDSLEGLEITEGEGEDETKHLPERLRQSMLLMLGHFYLVREPVIVGASVVKVPYGFDWLIAPFKNWTVK